ncbi:Pyruvate dehydrogenase (ubiquinone) [Burkholderia glumae]|nr:Pyruvate dehydrogenase (ubiquinone) [Burkholderia glumae]
MRKAFALRKPVLVDVVTARQEIALPPKIEWAQAKGFSLYMLKAVLNAKGNEVVELATTMFR